MIENSQVNYNSTIIVRTVWRQYKFEYDEVLKDWWMVIQDYHGNSKFEGFVWRYFQDRKF